MSKPVAFSQRNAARILRKIGEVTQTDSPRFRGNTSGPRWALVKAASIAPAAGSGFGAQCYQGWMQDFTSPDVMPAYVTAQKVWLTVLCQLSQNGQHTATIPDPNCVYPCLILGDVAADGTNTYPRAVAIIAPGAGWGGQVSSGADQAGVVTTGTQSFVGSKTFRDGVFTGEAGTAGTPLSVRGLHGTLDMQVWSDSPYVNTASRRVDLFNWPSGASANRGSLRVNGLVETSLHVLANDYIRAVNGFRAGASTGVSGTGGGGDTYVGGICTALGSGGGGGSGGVDSGDPTDITGFLEGDGSTISGVATIPIAKGGTGQTTASAALNALLPTQTSNAGKVLSTDGTNTSWAAASGGMPTGVVVPWTGTAAMVPAGWLLCDGSAVSRTTYADLWAHASAVISATLSFLLFGNGDGSTTFNVPDLRGRIPVGLDNMGGSSANRITQSWADSLGNSAGAEFHTLTSSESVPHTHGYTMVNANAAIPAPGVGAGPAYTGGFVTDSWGGSGGVAQPHSNVQPSIALNYIIKT